MSEGRTAETNGSRSFEERVFARFDAIDTRVDRLEVRFQQDLAAIDKRLEKLEAKQYDTKPIWEKVLAQLSTVKDELSTMKVELGIVKSDLGAVKDQISNIDRKFDVLTKDMMQLRGDQKYVHERLDRLESL